MKAAVFYGPGKIQIEEVETPVITNEEVLVKVICSAVCGTDVRIFGGKKKKGVRTPSIIGHETVGVVEKVGDAVHDFLPGDRVGVIPVIPCGNCYYCMHNRENACANRTAIGYEYDGGYAEYIRIPKEALKSGNLVPLPDSVLFEDAVLAEPLACCINGNRKSNISLGSTVIVIGAGPIGLFHIQLAKLSGAKNIIVSELIDHRLENAIKAGATRVVNPQNEQLENIVLELTDDLGADSLIMAIGIPQLINGTLKLVKKGATINLFAGFDQGTMAEIDPNIIHYNELNIVGTTASTRADYHEAMSLITNKLINTDIVRTKGYTLETIVEALNDVKTAKGMKSIVKIND